MIFLFFINIGKYQMLIPSIFSNKSAFYVEADELNRYIPSKDLTDLIYSYTLDIKLIFLSKKLILNSPKLSLMAVENYKAIVKPLPAVLNEETLKKDAVEDLRDIFNFEALRLSRLIGESNIDELKQLISFGIVPDSKHISIVFNNQVNDKTSKSITKETLELLEILVNAGAKIRKNHYKNVFKISSWQVRFDIIRLFNKKR